MTAVYVHDMGRAPDWKKPQNDGIWIDAKQAVYVLGSSRRGSMRAKETVPFAERAAAEKFAQKFGGKVANFAEIADDYVLGDKNERSGAKKSEPDTHADHKHHAGH